MWNKYKVLIADINFGKKRFLEYQLITKAILTLMIWPLINLMMNSLLKWKGYTYVTNGIITKFIMSPQGVIAVLSMCFIILFVVLIELGGLILMSNQVINREPASRYIPTLQFCLGKLPRFFSFEGLLVVIGVGILFPWLEIGGTTSLISQLQIPGFVQDVINTSALFLAIEFVVMGLGIYLFLRYVFVLHFVILGNNRTREAFKNSSRLMKSHRKAFFKELVSLTVLTFLMQALIMIFVGILLLAGYVALDDIPVEYIDLLLYTLVFIWFGVWIVLSFTLTPLGTLHLTRFFLENKDEDCVVSEVNLKYVPQNRIIDKLIFRKRNIPIVIVGAIAVSGLFSYGVLYEFENNKSQVDITAHRGNVMYAPENTIAALTTAAGNGADYAEIDVQQTRDGELILLHDSSLKRTTGENSNIWELTLKEVKELDAGSWFDESFTGEEIPTLGEAIEASKGKIKLNIEIKINGHGDDIVNKVVDEIYKYGIQNDCVVTSLDYDTLQAVENRASSLNTGYIMFVAMGDLSQLNIDFYSVEETNVTEKFVTNAHLLGREVHVWTINEADDMDKLINLGVDGIITDNEILLKEKLQGSNNGSNILSVIDQLM